MEISLIALDMDGTLLNSKKELSKENANVLRRAREKGIHVCFASGRMASLMTAFEREMETNCYFLGWNGACVIDKASPRSSSSTTEPSSSSTSLLPPSIFPSFADRAFHEEELRKLSERRRMFHQPVPRSACDRLIEFARGRDLHLNVYLSHHILAVDLPQHRWCIELYVKRADALFSLVKDFDELKTKIDEFGPPTKMLIVVPHEKREELYLELQPLFSSELNLVKSDPEYLEFLHKDVNKARGLAELCKELGISLRNVVAFGDGENDLEMLAEVGLGICMANGHPRAKAAARKVSNWTNDQSGVAKELELLLFSQQQ